jgi:hypothetical protein
MEQQQKRKMGGALAIDGRQSNILHTTTNQKQATATEGSMEGRCNKWEVWGKHKTIVLGGALELMEIKN